MAASQEPKYGKPWCWTCQAHKRYKYVRVSGDNHARKTICRSCGAMMWKPLSMNLEGVRFGCSLIYFAPTIGFFAFFLWERRSAMDNGALFLVIATFVVFLILPPAYLLHWSARKYAVWKKWAEERGWEEEKPYGK